MNSRDNDKTKPHIWASRRKTMDKTKQQETNKIEMVVFSKMSATQKNDAPYSLYPSLVIFWMVSAGLARAFGY